MENPQNPNIPQGQPTQPPQQAAPQPLQQQSVTSPAQPISNNQGQPSQQFVSPGVTQSMQSSPVQNPSQSFPQTQPARPAQPLQQAVQQPLQQSVPQGQPIQPAIPQTASIMQQTPPAVNQSFSPGMQTGPQMGPQPGGVGPRPPLRPGQRPLGQPGGPNPKKLVLGCLGFLGFSILLFVIFVIAFVSQTSASGENGLASALGVNPAEFTNTLILLTNLIFGTIVIVAFFVAVFGLFRAGMAPKTDKPAKSQGFRQAGIAGAVFLVMTMLWVFVYLYLNGKKVDIPQSQTTTAGIVTEPEITTRLTAPVDIKFDGTKIPYNPNRIELTFYQWDFGDGSSSTAPTVTHTYRNVGQYNVTLTVTARDKTSNETLTQSFSKLVTVSEVKVNADFTASPESGPAPLKVDFDGSSSSSPAGEIRTYEWDFRGQNSFRDATGRSASHTFQGEGEYEVKLRVTDNTGQTAIISKIISVGGPDVPVAVIDIPTTDGKYYVGKQLTFLGEKSTSPSGTVSKYEWDFGDGTPKANTRTATHTYRSAGLYEVILAVTDSAGKTGTSAQKITLVTQEQAPNAVIDSVPPLNDKTKSIDGQVPFEVQFNAGKSTDPDNNIVEFKWDFDGDGQTDAAGTTVSYVFKTAGSFNATLTAIDSAGNQSTAIAVVKVAPQDLIARLTADRVEGNVPLTVTFDASGSSYPDGQITSFEWDFGDGSPKRIDASQVSYKYNSIGTFTASVLAKASDGKTSKSEIVINVRPVSLQACFVPSAEQGPTPLTVEFDPRCSQGAVAKYLWDFGDGDTSRLRKPTHTFDKAGSYQVTLEVTDNQNVVNTFSKNILVTGEVQ